VIEHHNSVTLSLGGVNTTFQAGSPAIQLECSPKHLPFLISTEAEFYITVSSGEHSLFPSNSAVFSNPRWSFYIDQDQSIFRFQLRGTQTNDPPMMIVFQKDGIGAEIFYEPLVQENLASVRVEVPPAGLDELLAGHILGMQRGLMVHSCGLKTSPGTGLLFAGISGAGKSTTVRLWQEAGQAELLGDERVSVRKKNGGFWLHSTAWHGKGQTAAPATVPLRHLFILDHAGSNHARPLKPFEAVSLLLPRAYLPYWDRSGMEFSLAFLEDLCSSIPCYHLGFTPDRRAVDYVQCLISS
jgi:hypothetical protein